jgi:hypothetical protein
VKAKMTKRRLHRIEPKGPPVVGAYMSTDMKGPFRISGLRGERLYQGFLCGASKFLVAKCFEFKSASPRNLENVLLKTPFLGKLTQYHADGAPELISKEIVQMLLKTGATVSYSAPYTSTDNAAIERSHRTIFESAHALLLHACLPVTYWTYAVDHAVYIYNRIPTNTEFGHMAPLKAAFSIESDLSQERTFGANCYGIIPQETRLKGFTDKGYKAIYLGHRGNGSPGFYLLLVESNIIKECSHVTFDESDLDSGERAKRQTPAETLEVDPVPKDIEDFRWLVGMAYRDENVLYMTTRISEEGRFKFLVAYRGAVTNNTVGAEEERPVHVANVAILVNKYLQDNTPLVSTEGSGLCSIDGGGEITSAGASDEGNSELATSQASAATTHKSVPLTRKGSTPGDDGPTGAVGSETAAGRQEAPTGIGKLSGEAAPARALSVPTWSRELPRSRAQRVPLNIGVMGDVERVFSITDFDTEYVYTLSDDISDITQNDDLLLYSDVIRATEHRSEWMTAGRGELISIVRDNDVWVAADLPKGKKALTTKWVFKRKRKRGQPDKYKGRLCVRGFEQLLGVDYWETYAPTAKWVTLRLFLSICACLGLRTRQLDVKTAFLYADLEEEIYIECPKGVNRQNPFGLPPDVLAKCDSRYFRLKKSLYGLKQAPRNWFMTLKTFILEQGFSPVKSDSCVFVQWTEGRAMLLIVFVDDILIGAENDRDMVQLVQAFKDRFKITDSGEVDVYLSVHVERNWARRTMDLDQTDYILQMWRTFKGVENLRVKTPFEEGWRVDNDEENKRATPADRAFAASFPYRELVGSLLFIQLCTRGDIAYNVHYLARFSNAPCKAACLAAMRVLQHLYNTRSRKLTLGGTENPLLSLFCDTDFAACPYTRRSVECYLLYLGIGCIMWQVKRQGRVAQSTGEAEFLALTPGCNMVVWVRTLLKELQLGYTRATAVYTDNETARALSANTVKHSTMKQISLKYFLAKDLSDLSVTVTGRIDTSENPADLGTKPLGFREYLKKANYFFDGIAGAVYERLARPLTTITDEYV